MTRPPDAHRLEFLAACDPVHSAHEITPETSASEAVNNLIQEIYSGDGPAWTAAPGSLEGLAALRTIMEALGYHVYWFETWMLVDIVKDGGWVFNIKEDRCERVNVGPRTWADNPEELPRLLHHALALAPAGPEGGNA